MQDKRDAGLEGCRTGGMQDKRMQDKRDAGQEVCRIRGMQDKRYAG